LEDSHLMACIYFPHHSDWAWQQQSVFDGQPKNSKGKNKGTSITLSSASCSH
jgi:hypothetical protein